ncbi:MAG: ABC transporter permease, partial [Cellulosilyticaceae bacterium]
MLGKLIKYEFKATGRTFLPLYGAILIVALVQRFFGRSSQELFEELNRIGDFATIALVALFMALGVITLVVTIQRFQKSLLSDEGYLMFTLPVKTRSLIASKMIVATTWVILSGVVG